MDNIIIPQEIERRIEILNSEEKKPVVNAGRPTVMTNATLQKLKQGFLMGFDDVEACVYAGIGKSTLYNFQNEYPEFVELKQDWKANPFLKAKATIYKSLEEKEGAQWFLERKKKEEYSLRRELDIVDAEVIEEEIEKLENNKTDYGQVAEKARSELESSGQAQG